MCCIPSKRSVLVLGVLSFVVFSFSVILTVHHLCIYPQVAEAMGTLLNPKSVVFCLLTVLEVMFGFIFTSCGFILFEEGYRSSHYCRHLPY